MWAPSAFRDFTISNAVMGSNRHATCGSPMNVIQCNTYNTMTFYSSVPPRVPQISTPFMSYNTTHQVRSCELYLYRIPISKLYGVILPSITLPSKHCTWGHQSGDGNSLPHPEQIISSHHCPGLGHDSTGQNQDIQLTLQLPVPKSSSLSWLRAVWCAP